MLHSIKNVSFEDRPVKPLGNDHEVRVHIKQTGICGSDVHYWQRGRIGEYILKSPIVLGHESAGTVVAIGTAVKSLKIGDRVAIEPGTPCRYCDYCRNGTYNNCSDMVFAATPPFDGTLCKYYNVAADFCYKLPEHMSFEEGAMVEPTGTVTRRLCAFAAEASVPYLD